jgi:membrane protein YqaA with SNARE-associated domain
MWKQAYGGLAQWSQRPQGAYLLFGYALAESCVIPLPADPLLIALCAGAPKKALRFGLICGMGSVVGGLLGYAVGHYAFETVGQSILQWYDPELTTFARVEGIYADWGFWGVLMAAVTPIPYKVFTLASGVFDFHLGQFLLASVIGRNLRFVGLAALMAWGGDRVRQWHEQSGAALWGLLAVMTLLGLYGLAFF